MANAHRRNHHPNRQRVECRRKSHRSTGARALVRPSVWPAAVLARIEVPWIRRSIMAAEVLDLPTWIVPVPITIIRCGTMRSATHLAALPHQFRPQRPAFIRICPHLGPLHSAAVPVPCRRTHLIDIVQIIGRPLRRLARVAAVSVVHRMRTHLQMVRPTRTWCATRHRRTAAVPHKPRHRNRSRRRTTSTACCRMPLTHPTGMRRFAGTSIMIRLKRRRRREPPKRQQRRRQAQRQRPTTTRQPEQFQKRLRHYDSNSVRRWVPASPRRRKIDHYRPNRCTSINRQCHVSLPPNWNTIKRIWRLRPCIRGTHLLHRHCPLQHNRAHCIRSTCRTVPHRRIQMPPMCHNRWPQWPPIWIPCIITRWHTATPFGHNFGCHIRQRQIRIHSLPIQSTAHCEMYRIRIKRTRRVRSVRVIWPRRATAYHSIAVHRLPTLPLIQHRGWARCIPRHRPKQLFNVKRRGRAVNTIHFMRCGRSKILVSSIRISFGGRASNCNSHFHSRCPTELVQALTRVLYWVCRFFDRMKCARAYNVQAVGPGAGWGGDVWIPCRC